MTEQTYTFKNGDLFIVDINGIEKKFIIEPSKTEHGTPMINGVSIDGTDTLKIEHAKKIDTAKIFNESGKLLWTSPTEEK